VKSDISNKIDESDMLIEFGNNENGFSWDYLNKSTVLRIAKYLNILADEMEDEKQDPIISKEDENRGIIVSKIEREFPYDRFKDLIGCLDAKIGLIAHLLYFGGDITLKEVVGIQIGDIDFANHRIVFDSHAKTYPEFIFNSVNGIISFTGNEQQANFS
jgi:hypothetical protein